MLQWHLDTLRQAKEAKIQEGYASCDGGFCAAGLLLSRLPYIIFLPGSREDVEVGNGELVPFDTRSRTKLVSTDQVAAALEMSEDVLVEIIDMNDRGVSFREIADRLQDRLRYAA